MYQINDKDQIEKYKQEMYALKEKTRNGFFKMSNKRKIIVPFIKHRWIRDKIEKYLPYAYNEIDKEKNYFCNDRIAIYTGIYGDYDPIYDPVIVPDNCDFLAFSDKKIESKIWKSCEYTFPEELGMLTNAEKNRFIKMHPHLILPQYEYSIYIDGNIEIITDFSEYLYDINKYGFVFHNHYKRNCIYSEIDECIRQKKCSISQLESYRKKLQYAGMPYGYGLLEAPIIVRKHFEPQCISVMNQWWDEYYKFIKRDQIALIYVLWKNGIKPDEVNQLGRDIHANYSFIQHSHKHGK